MRFIRVYLGHRVTDCAIVRSIDDAVQQSCKDVVFDCVTVGSGRPSPALLVEPTEQVERDAIPRIIIERLSAFNHSRLPHERLDDPRLVLVVKRGALPRTVVSDNPDSLCMADIH